MDDVSIVICGAAGQGIQTVEEFLANILKLSGYHIFATREVMSRVRGGTNSTEMRISSKRVAAYVHKIDILMPLDKSAMKHVEYRITPDTYILSDPENIDESVAANKDKIFKLPYTETAKEIGNKIYSNTVAVGVVASFFEVEDGFASNFLNEKFSSKGKEVIENNIKAYQKGYEIGLNLKKEKGLKFEIQKPGGVENDILFNGNEAVGLGAIAGGCNFIAAYPMSPSTGLMVFLAKHSDEFGIVVDQAEDEIAAINKNIGAWYAGARAIASTSGGGFALMTEGLSLAGMTETPIVIHIAQRPAPATGLPTRTAQEDLTLALYAGHGEFPRIIYAPGTIEQAFYLTQRAFNKADQYQIPVFILTDQFFVDSYYNIPELNLETIDVKKKFIKTEKDYLRYKFTEDGISPRGVPGFGDGFVRVDSDEHDESGSITEDMLHIRPKMVKKRLFLKSKLLKKDILEPELIGLKDYETLVICWGSTYHVVKEAINNLQKISTDKNKTDKKIAMLHYRQVWPLHLDTNALLTKAKTVIDIENNARGQFANLIKLYADYEIAEENKFLKFTGEPFAVEEIEEFLKNRTIGGA